MPASFPYYPKTYEPSNATGGLGTPTYMSGWTSLFGMSADPAGGGGLSPAQQALNIWGTNTSPYEGGGFESKLGGYGTGVPKTPTTPGTGGPTVQQRTTAYPWAGERSWFESLPENIRGMVEKASPEYQDWWYGQSKLPGGTAVAMQKDFMLPETPGSARQIDMGPYQAAVEQARMAQVKGITPYGTDWQAAQDKQKRDALLYPALKQPGSYGGGGGVGSPSMLPPNYNLGI